MVTGVLLALFGLAVLGAEGWLASTGAVAMAIPLMVLTMVTLAIVLSELREDWR